MEKILFDSAKGLLDIGTKMKDIDESISDMILFLSDRVINIAEAKGYLESNKQFNCQDDCSLKDVTDLSAGNTQCNGHCSPSGSTTCSGHGTLSDNSNLDTQLEVKKLVEQIRSESKNVR